MLVVADLLSFLLLADIFLHHFFSQHKRLIDCLTDGEFGLDRRDSVATGRVDEKR